MSIKRVAFMALGCISLALAVLGVVLPICQLFHFWHLLHFALQNHPTDLIIGLLIQSFTKIILLILKLEKG